MKTYKTVLWTKRPQGIEHDYHAHFEGYVLDSKHRKVLCVTCSEVIHESITEHYYQTRFTGREQGHLDSESHKNMVELARLS